MERSRLALALALAACASGCGLFDEEDDAPPPPPIASAPPSTAAAQVPVAAPPYGAVPMSVISARRSYVSDAYTLVLTDATRSRSLPMRVGATEGRVIERRLSGRAYYGRPGTHDLLDNIVRVLGARVLMVEIQSLQGDAFIGYVHLWDGERTQRLEARSADAIALALAHAAPIYVAAPVLAQSAVHTAY